MIKKVFIVISFVLLMFVSSCDPVTYEVTFDSMGGSPVEPIQSFTGHTIELPETTKEGFTFLGWFTGDTVNDSQFTNTSVVSRNLTLYARWEANTYTITYETHISLIIPSQSYTYGSTIDYPDDPYASGYTFVGWFLDYSTYLEPFEFETMPAMNVTLHAKFVANPLQPHDYYFTGQFAGWGDAVGNDDYKGVEVSPSDSRLTPISDRLIDTLRIIILEITLPAGEAGWTMTYRIDGVLQTFDGNLSIKLIRTNVDDEIPNWWGQSPESGPIICLTEDSLYIPPFVEENIDQQGGWNDNPVAFAPGTYYAVYVVYADGGQGMGLIPKT